MKKSVKIISVILLIIIISITSYICTLLYIYGCLFSSWGRYDDSTLKMEVPWEDPNEIYNFNQGYSESEDCPWGRIHNGIDFFLNDSAKVLAMAPGQVQLLELRDTHAAGNRYHILVHIRFSMEFELIYGFEPHANNISAAQKQLDDLKINLWDWVDTGDHIADFVFYEDGAHIHFGLKRIGEYVCPKNYFSDNGYNEMMDLIHNFHPSWEMCYD